MRGLKTGLRGYVAAACGITVPQGKIEKSSGQVSHSSPQLRITKEKRNFVCPDSSQITRLLFLLRDLHVEQVSTSPLFSA